MGISTISKLDDDEDEKIWWEFQSPMGISTISKRGGYGMNSSIDIVSIPNGDKHDFKTKKRKSPTTTHSSFNPQWG